MGGNDYLGWVLAAKRWQKLPNSFFPFCLPWYQGMNCNTSVAHPKPCGNVPSHTWVALCYKAGDTPCPWSLFLFPCLEHQRCVAQYNYMVCYMLWQQSKAIRKERIRAKTEAGKATARECSLNLLWLVLALTSVSTKGMFWYVPFWFLVVFILCVYWIVFPAAACPG